MTLLLPKRELVTMMVLYYMPAHPLILQEFLWQTRDIIPQLPRVHRFLNFWRRELDAPIHSVLVSAAGQELPLRHVDWVGRC